MAILERYSSDTRAILGRYLDDTRLLLELYSGDNGIILERYVLDLDFFSVYQRIYEFDLNNLKHISYRVHF